MSTVAKMTPRKKMSEAEWQTRVENGAVLVVEGVKGKCGEPEMEGVVASARTRRDGQPGNWGGVWLAAGA